MDSNTMLNCTACTAKTRWLFCLDLESFHFPQPVCIVLSSSTMLAFRNIFYFPLPWSRYLSEKYTLLTKSCLADSLWFQQSPCLQWYSDWYDCFQKFLQTLIPVCEAVHKSNIHTHSEPLLTKKKVPKLRMSLGETEMTITLISSKQPSTYYSD